MKSLTPKEVEFLKLLAAGKSSGEIQHELRVGNQRVSEIRINTRRKLDLRAYATDVEIVRKWDSTMSYAVALIVALVMCGCGAPGAKRKIQAPIPNVQRSTKAQASSPASQAIVSPDPARKGLRALPVVAAPAESFSSAMAAAVVVPPPVKGLPLKWDYPLPYFRSNLVFSLWHMTNLAHAQYLSKPGPVPKGTITLYTNFPPGWTNTTVQVPETRAQDFFFVTHSYGLQAVETN